MIGPLLNTGRAAQVAFPWAQVLAIGLGVLRLSPDQFWSMTPREFAAALRGLYGERTPPLDRASFQSLVDRFPDQPKDAR
jgi:uncharacterized phage protein (TIGR02216 family)